MAEKILEIGWDQLLLPQFVVGEQTKGNVHPGDTAYWKAGDNIFFENVYSIHEGSGVLLFSTPKSVNKGGLLPLGTNVKIRCPHK
ncbi:MAG: hypothetical protein WC894_01235 [Patescibacteria group bacterium]